MNSIMNHIEKQGICRSCNGTGLYQGMGERPPYAVVCNSCKGTGCKTYVLEWEDFTARAPIPDSIKIVVERNSGICIGGGEYDFGGLPVDKWLAGESFTGRENRLFTCPYWWTSQGWKGGPCDEINLLGSLFSNCPNFPNKAECWAMYDKKGVLNVPVP